ncbi:hypothetical protein vseg_010359 [Gypsophila vaccaria]
MNLLSYNCQGLGNDPAVVQLKKLLKRENADVVVLQETKLSGAEMQRVVKKLVEYEGFFGDSVGRKAGVAILWRKGVIVNYISASAHHIDVEIEGLFSNTKWRLTGFYGWADRCKKELSWKLIRDIKEFSNLPWMIIGDFNQILYCSEKKGGTPRMQGEMDEFRAVLDQCGLLDLGFTGDPFTWWNKQSEPNDIFERLDRALVTPTWIDIFPTIVVSHLPRETSDHVPLKVARLANRSRRKNRQFKFENFWTNSENCESVIREAWDANGDESLTGSFLTKANRCVSALTKWSAEEFGNINKKLGENRKRLAFLDSCRPTEEVVMERRSICDDNEKLIIQEEMYWKQRARIDYLTEGDRNTKFFHLKASGRRRRNRITKLEGPDGHLTTEEEELEDIAVDFFKELFTSTHPCNFEEVLSSIEPKVTDEINNRLLRPFSTDEVKIALDQMHPNKAPGPDGLNANFFKTYWHIVGGDVSEFVIDILNGTANISHINKTHIVLIPKTNNAQSMNDFRPISLCNVVYKLVAKVIVNRMKECMDKIVSEEQSAFVPGRLISDNAVIAFEAYHHLKSHSKGSTGFMAFKLDMSKAYDRVEWDFLKAMMSRLGFAAPWVDKVMKCVSTVSSSVLLNGRPSRALTPERGLRQGDPLSPFLFILCAEAFSKLIAREVHRKGIEGIKICRGAPTITHLFFVDDSILFCKANLVNANNIVKIIRQYEEVSGQRINMTKSEIYFSPSTKSDVKQLIGSVIGAKTVIAPSKYLGLPAIVGKNKTEAFAYIKERIWKKLKGWKERTLSYAGREVLIKAVAQSIPTYHMGLFKLPKSLCDDLNRSISKFWWGHRDEGRHITWVAWSKLCSGKNEGGLGFRHIDTFNLAMLGKQLWRFIEAPSSLVTTLLKARYFPNCSVIEATIGNHPSYVWRSLMEAKWVLEKGCRWLIGNGKSVRFWEDRWTLSVPSFRIWSPRRDQHNSFVAEWFLGAEWNVTKVRESLIEQEANEILRIPISPYGRDDKLTWNYAKDGVYSVKTAYHFIRWSLNIEQASSSSNAANTVWQTIWRLEVPPKVRPFLWRLCKGALPTGANIQKRVPEADPTCCRCSAEIETDAHALLYCSESDKVWDFAETGGKYVERNVVSMVDWVWHLLAGRDMTEMSKYAMIAWAIWNERNKVLHGGVKTEAREVYSRALHLWMQYRDFTSRAGCGADAKISRPIHWQRPSGGSWKINVDGAVLGDKGSGMGVIIRTDSGNVCRAMTFQTRCCWSPDIVEAKAAMKGLALARQLSIGRVILESDSLQLISALKTRAIPNNYFGNVVRDILDYEPKFTSLSFSFVRRNGNRAAHRMAHFCPIDYSTRVWVETYPDCIADIVAADFMLDSDSY